MFVSSVGQYLYRPKHLELGILAWDWRYSPLGHPAELFTVFRLSVWPAASGNEDGAASPQPPFILTRPPFSSLLPEVQDTP